MNLSSRRVVFIVFLLSLITPLTPLCRLCYAQVASSAINGSVSDSSGAAIPDLKIKITSKSTGFSRSAVTNAAGQYEIRDLLPGTYDISVEATGFKREVAQNIDLYVGRTTTQDFRLELGTVREQVTVRAETSLLTTTSGELGTIIDGPAVSQLPLNGRNFMQLNLLSPGAVVDKNSNTALGDTLSPSGVGFSVNGHFSDYNMYLMDGTELKEVLTAQNLFSPSVEAIQEFQTTTSNYSADFGTEAAGQINVVTKSGTDQLHGAAWEFLRNDDFDARNFFQTGVVPPFKRNQFGANIGGPVVLPKLYNGKDKMFFFFNYEGYRQVKMVAETATYPTAAELAGNLSALVPNGKLQNPFTGQAFSGSVIPPNMIRPATLESFLQNGIGKGPWLPLPNISAPGYNYDADSNSSFFDSQYITRIDKRISDNTSIYGRFTMDKEFQSQPSITPNWYVTQTVSDYTIAGHLTHVFSPTFVFVTAEEFSHFEQQVHQSTAFVNNIVATLGIQGGSVWPDSWGAPVWAVSGFSGLGEVSYGPRGWWINTFDLRPTFTLTKGNHIFKWGMDFQRNNGDFPEIFRTYGNYTFNGTFSTNALGDFLLDLPQSIVGAPNPFAMDAYASELSPYFQDDWKVTKNLTFNLGLRYTWNGIPLSHNNRSISNVYFPPNFGTPTLVIADDASPITFRGVQETFSTAVPYVRASSVGLPEQLAFNYYKDIEPRFGFAYRLASNAVLRGGFGIYDERDSWDKWSEAAVDPPFVQYQNITLGSTNFRSFDPLNPFSNYTASAAQIAGNDVHQKAARSEEWNLTLEKTWHDTLYSIAYVGNVDMHLPDLEDPNLAAPGPGSTTSRRRWPSVGVLNIQDLNGIANYNALQLHAQHNFSKGLELLASYSWSKTMDNASGDFVGEGQRYHNELDYMNKTGSYGLADQHIGQRFVVSYIYVLPVGRGKYLNTGGVGNAVLGGWQINGITSANTGTPITVSQAYNVANIDLGTNRPDQIGKPNDLSHGRPRGQQVAEFFDTSAFRQADLTNGTYRFGNAGRNTIIGPGTFVSDFGLYRNFKIRERGQLQFRAEAYNIFNRAIFQQPGIAFATTQFGVLTSTAVDAREIQLALRLTW
jgi:hypothetical protein